MQKKLSDYLKILIDQKDSVLHEFYEPGSLLLSDEAVILLGLLLGLNVVDCNLCLKVIHHLQLIKFSPLLQLIFSGGGFRQSARSDRLLFVSKIRKQWC